MLKILFKVLSANLVVLAMKLISGFVFPRFMTTQAYADYQTFSLYLSYITILNLGFSTGMFVNYGGKTFDQIDKSRYKSEVVVLVGILVVFTVLFGIIWVFFPNRMLLYVTLCILPYCLVCSYQSLYQAWGKFNQFSTTHVVTMAVPLLGSTLLLLIFRKMEAEYYIFLFIAIYLLYTLIILFGAAKSTRRITRAPYFDQTNLQTLKLGFSICIGNYVNVLLGAVNKQFVKSLFDTTSFAVYSFGLSLQSLMMVFITSISQPMYNFLASGKVDQERHCLFMRMLLVLGACSGIAHHVCCVIVEWLVPKYMASMEVTAIYFMVFPALAVINCLYINLYKISRQSKQYIRTLVGILILSVTLNAAFVFLRKEITSITFATVVIYYIWLFLDSRRFRTVRFGLKDALFLAGYFAAYLISLQIANPILAAVVYTVLLLVVCCLVYREVVGVLMNTLCRKLGFKK